MATKITGEGNQQKLHSNHQYLPSVNTSSFYSVKLQFSGHDKMSMPKIVAVRVSNQLKYVSFDFHALFRSPAHSLCRSPSSGGSSGARMPSQGAFPSEPSLGARVCAVAPSASFSSIQKPFRSQNENFSFRKSGFIIHILGKSSPPICYYAEIDKEDWLLSKRRVSCRSHRGRLPSLK